MRQQYAVVVLFALIVASCMTSFGSYRSTERQVLADVDQALAQALQEQQSPVISADTIQSFNSHLHIEALRGRAVLAVDTRQGFCPHPQVSAATVFALSDQRPALALWTVTLLWLTYCLWQRRRMQPVAGGYGGLLYDAAEGRFYTTQGEAVALTPMQQQLMEMFFRSPSHQLTKAEICDALWPKKDDASETLYTLIRRLKPVVERHSALRIEADRGRAYRLLVR